MTIRKVFLSSSVKDLAEYRDAAFRAIQGLREYHCVRMEDFGAVDQQADKFCRAMVKQCALFVGIIGLRYGSCPPGSEKSYTEREYDAAVAFGIPCLLFLTADDFPSPATVDESDAARKKQQIFRQRIASELIHDTFPSPEDLGRRVIQAIHNWEREINERQIKRGILVKRGILAFGAIAGVCGLLGLTLSLLLRYPPQSSQDPILENPRSFTVDPAWLIPPVHLPPFPSQPPPNDCEPPPSSLKSLTDKTLLEVINETGRPLRVFSYRKLVSEEKAKADWSVFVVESEKKFIDEWRGGCHYFMIEVGGANPPQPIDVGWRDTRWRARKLLLHRSLLEGEDVHSAVEVIFPYSSDQKK